MNDKSPNPKYAPHFFHRLYNFLDRIPISLWILYPALLLTLGFFANLEIWVINGSAIWDFELSSMSSGARLVESIALLHFMVNSSGSLLDGYKSVLDIPEEKYNLLRFKFTIIPRRQGNLLSLAGITVGIILSQAVLHDSNLAPSQPPFSNAVHWGFSLAVAFVSIFLGIRQLGIIDLVFKMTKKVPLWDSSKIYAFSRYTATIGIGIIIIANITPAIVNPNSFSNDLVTGQTLVFSIIAVATFYYPLRVINQRITKEKDRLLKEVNLSLERLYNRLHSAELNEDYSNAAGMQSLVQAINEERTNIEKFSTWPWRKSTVTTLLSAIFLPILLNLINIIFNLFLQ